MLLIRIWHPQSPPAFIRHFEGGVIGVVHDPKQATCYDNETRAQQIVKKVMSSGRVELVDRDTVLK